MLASEGRNNRGGIFLNTVSLLDSQGREIFSSLSLDVKPGTWTGIVGPNGSGKSALARMLAGIYLPTKGEVLVDDLRTRVPRERRAIRQRVAYLASDPENQFVAPTVFDEVTFGLQAAGLPPQYIIGRAHAALTMFGLEQFRDIHPIHLSVGEQFRLLLAAAHAREPDYLILDDVTSMMDAVTRSRVEELMQRWRAERKLTIVMLTHRLSDLRYADRIVALKAGGVLADDTTAEAWQRAVHEEIASVQPPPVFCLYQQLSSAARRKWPIWNAMLPANLMGESDVG